VTSLYDYGNQGYGNQAPNMYAGYQVPRRRRTGRKLLITLIVVLALLVGLDFGAKAFAENEAAAQIQKHGFPTKPTVLIAGFPFLTQVITRHFEQITIKASNIPEGPIKISSLNVVADNVHLNSSFNGGTAGPLHGTVLISLGEIGGVLSAAGSISSFLGGGSSALRIASVGSNEVKGSLTAVGGIVSWSATWRVQTAGPHEIMLHLVSTSGGVPSGLVGAAGNISIPLNSLPAGLQLTGGLNSSSSGITAHVFAQTLSFGS
jgi:LmeA-like phospholipid-binding